MNNRYIAPILLSLILTALPCMAQNNPATNNVPKVEKPDPEDDKCECGCDYASQAEVKSISFIQSFGQSPWISGAPKGMC